MQTHFAQQRIHLRTARALLLLMLLGLLLVACGPGDAPDVDTNGATGATPTVAAQPVMGTTPTTAAGGAPSTLDQIRERGTLRVGVKYDAPPFGSLNPATGEVTGFDVDVARGIAGEILGDPEKIELVQVTSQNRIPLLQNGQIDMFAATATITPSRLEEISFSDVYYRAGQSLLVRNDSDIQSYEDLAGKSTCTVSGSTPEQTIRRLVPDAEVQVFETYPECFAALRDGRVDSITTDNVLLEGLRQQDPENLKLVGGLFTFEPYGIGIAKGNDELRDAVNDALGNLRDQYPEYYQKHLNEDELPADFEEWFLLDAQKAAAAFEAQSQPDAATTPGAIPMVDVTPTLGP